MTLAAVAARTRIAPHHLDALERSDLDGLPAGPFGRSYIRSYAVLLGIDPAPILDAYHVQEVRRGVGTPERDQRMLQELSHLVAHGHEAGSPLARLRTRPAALAAAALLAVMLGIVGWRLLAGHAASERPAQPAPPVAEAAARPSPLSPPQPRSRADRITPPPAARVPPSPLPPAERPARTASAAGSGEQAKPAASALPTDTLRVSGFGVGTDVVDRRLVGRSDRFPAGTRVFFWTLVAGGQRGQLVRHVWFQGGRAVMRADLPIGGPHWRTRSSLVLPDGSTGSWTVEARTSDGRLLARNDFVCEPRPSR
jgi:cytoskeletal protein RodZ